MTNLELSNEFDILYNNITSNQAPGLDEYEKSVFLTKAQDEIIKSYFNPKLNKVQEGFDGSERRQIDFSMITRVKTINSFYDATLDNHHNTKAIIIDEDIMMFINEFVEVNRDRNQSRLVVVPIDYSTYSTLMSKPYTRPHKNQAWRLLYSSSRGKNIELIIGPDDTLVEYQVRYIIKPKPIILVPLHEEGLSVGGGYLGTDANGALTKDLTKVKNGSECELDPIIHPEILQRAVELAKAAYIGDIQTQISLGSSSQTNIGIIPQSR